jgi:2-dehydropantoate 2-reductase
MTQPKIAVFGAGGVGGYFAATLARAGYHVALIARGRNLEAIRQSGLHVESPNGNFNIAPAQVSDNPSDVGPVDAVILTVKAWQVTDAAHAMRPLLGPATRVLTLQNGVEAYDQLVSVLGLQHPLMGLCRIISSLTSPGHVHHGGMEPTVVLGERDGSPLAGNARALADALKSAGATVESTSDIEAALWAKLLFIAAVSGTGAVSRATIGEIRQCAPTRELLRQIMEEVAAVALARGIRLAPDVIPGTLAFVEKIPATGTASMQRDIADGRPSELEAIIGVLTRFGDEGRVATPAIDYIYASLLPQENRARSPK